ncbi:N-acetylmuramoyl-L-alanine amidase AmiA precursor [Pseudoruegeria aquimaris]|uniref:N-acetylmuramoyl-L-alanine amidase n=1 Tax=Pseudoruegeria aquimaris TaxID=393663 RepID=A0A1Y5RA38_9RHOB|nr:N-acetylmuramoyl-L-alanine amidase [Pseudoruegeria aquimaris]SLN11508.1 N-acetylmuramoyl-L-alanine amidase AmiA precursor [Pseudoruegeria aquimaris]
MLRAALRILLVGLLACAPQSGALRAQEFSALARLEAARSGVADARGGGIEAKLLLSQPVPYRVFTLDEPRRVVLDFREVDFSGITPDDLLSGSNATGLRFGVFRPGWSRMVIDLAGPQAVVEAGMRTDPATGRAAITLRTEAVDAETYAAQAGPPPGAGWERPQPADVPPLVRRQDGSRPLRVVLDPGHGGIDPGAERGGHKEADLMLTFARELKEKLLRAGGYEVLLTREEDVFVPLETRVSIARAFGADVFLSLHADALAEGRATGTTLYTLSDRASDRASALLAERHDRDQLLAGVDLTEQDDVIAIVLMEMVRRDTMPRADKLASALLDGLKANEITLYKKPKLSAGFSVLKSPDIPSVLIELGFLSNPSDLDRLQDAAWRDRAAGAILDGLKAWAAADAAEARLLRK